MLPLVERSAINNLWIQIEREAPSRNTQHVQVQAVQAFISYVVSTWVDEDAARFKRDIWNHWENQGPRTTNHIEGKPQFVGTL